MSIINEEVLNKGLQNTFTIQCRT